MKSYSARSLAHWPTGVLVLSLVLTSGAPCAAQAIPGLTRPSVLPRADFFGWRFANPDNYTAVKQACQLTDPQIDALLHSEDPLDRGLGIFLLDQRCDFRGLLLARHLLDDHAQSIPSVAGCTGVLVGEFPSGEPQTVHDYIRHALGYFLGENPDTQAELDALLAGVADPDSLAYAWVRRLDRAAGMTPEFLARPDIHAGGPLPCVPMEADVKAGVQALPADIRWVVVSSAKTRRQYSYSDAEAAAIFQQIAAELAGHINPDASPAWTQPGGMSLDKQGTVATLQRLAPSLIAQP